jgi:hypothetical protein
MADVIPIDVAQRLELDDQVRKLLRSALERGMEVDEVSFLLARMLAEIADQPRAIGHVLAAFDCAPRRELDAAMPFDTGELEKPSGVD